MFTLDLSEKKKMLVRNMWKVYTRPTSASDFLGRKIPKTLKFAIQKILYKLSIFKV
jgi:hypothetical protein